MRLRTAGAMKTQTRTRFVSDDDVSDDSALESDVSSLTDGDTGSEDGRSPQPAVPRRDGTRSPRPRAIAKTTSFRAMTSESRDKRCATRKDRMLMRDWLQQQASRRSIPNMQWFNKECTMIRIPWKHGSRSGWTIDDCQLYRAWAKYTGR